MNWVSSAYASIKSFAASTIVSAIPGCSTLPGCSDAVQIGLNTGLAALGMPPELPDFEQLEAMGEGYLADAIAQQVVSKSGLPISDEAKGYIKDQVKAMIDKGKQAMQGSTDSSLWIPDDGHQYKPLLLTLSVKNPSTTGSTPAMYLELSEPDSSRYSATTVAIPALAPGEWVNVAIALQAVKDPKAWVKQLPTREEYIELGYAALDSQNKLHHTALLNAIQKKNDQAKSALAAWLAQYRTEWVILKATLKLPPFVAKDVYKTSCFGNKLGCLVQ